MADKRVRPQIPPAAKWNRIIIIGEAPGEQEAQAGRPFVGPSGQLLNEMLATAKIQRKNCIVLNPFQTRPPNNRIEYFFTRPGEVKPEFRAEIKRFQRTLEKYQPAVLLTFGRTAAWAVSHYLGPLSDRFGKIYLSDYGPVWHLFHPAYFLRGNKQHMAAQIRHLRLARKIARRLL